MTKDVAGAENLKMMGRSIPEERPRKRFRKGTKSCWECKRRKVKCNPSPESGICTGCLERRTPCLSQEYVDDQPSQPAEDLALARRMAKVEALLERLIERIPHDELGDLTPTSIPVTIDEPRALFTSPPHSYRGQAEVGSAIGKLEILRQRLAGMLPTQADVDLLFSSSHGWWFIQQHIMTHLPDSIDDDSRGIFNISTVSQAGPMIIARLLLCIAICVQQLPPDFETETFETMSPIRERTRNVIEFLIQNVTSDDEITATIEGVECLALQGIYEVNAGNLRKSWLAYRKAVTQSQLLGLHRGSVSTSQADEEFSKTRQHHLWFQVARGERYLSTLLGVPTATGSTVLPFNDGATWLSPEEVYHKHLYNIAGLILARNQEDSTYSFSATLRISEQLDALAERMPTTWWEIPTQIPLTRTKEASTQFERVMCQIWHFELGTLLHLPFMLRAAADRRYEHSRVSCLNASRNLIGRWLAIRENQQTFYFSNLIDFEAFTATITLLLGLLHPEKKPNQTVLQERREDSELVETVVLSFKRLKQQGGGMSVGDQSISVIRKLQGILYKTEPCRYLCLDIPFFGTIRIASSGAVQPLEGERILGANPRHNISPQHGGSAVNYSWTSLYSTSNLAPLPETRVPRGIFDNEEIFAANDFTTNDIILQCSGGHLQLGDTPNIFDGDLDLSQGLPQDSDMIFFDSVVNTDLMSSWSFSS